MSASVNHPAIFTSAPADAGVAARAGAIPWYIWTGVVAITSSAIGGAWDVAWHRSIGRDTFWTAAHMAIYVCGVLAGVICAWLIARSTFTRDPQLRAASVQIFGLRAPLGAFLAGWGCVAMATSAPFDNWWHNAYGLDVKIVSPPHALLILGLRGISTPAGAVSVCGRPGDRGANVLSAGIYMGRKIAPCIGLRRDGHRTADIFRALLAGFPRALGSHRDGCGVYRVFTGRDFDFPALPCPTETWPGVQPGDAPDPGEVPYFDPCAGAGA
jgi:hypothetical protein